MMQGTLFIYGSLCEGSVHFEKIRDHILDIFEAEIHGSVYRMPTGYPVYLRHGSHRITGQIVRLIQPETVFSALDDLHGVCINQPENGVYDRLEVEAFTKLNSLERCFVYALQASRLPRNAKLIEGGDWAKSLREFPAIPMRLSERQKSYIKKLAGCSGRDIVPIDLSLYRELLHLDLVVDKGRRLALTPLGQDVFRYLS